jgi:hypothetical protein
MSAAGDIRMSRRALVLLFLVLAVVCYAIGFGAGAVAFIVLGAAAEILFWVHLFRRRRSDAK